MPKKLTPKSYVVMTCLLLLGASRVWAQDKEKATDKETTKAATQTETHSMNPKSAAQGLDIQKLEKLLDSNNDANGPVGPTHNNGQASNFSSESCPSVDPVELKTLLKLRDRRMELDSREHALHTREQELNQAKQKIQERLDALDSAILKLETKLELGEPRRKIRDEQMKSLADSISKLSAKKSAPILSEADPDTVAKLLLHLDSARMASLLAAMPSAKAGRIIDIVGKDKQSGSVSNRTGKNRTQRR